ncbi:Pancreatic triacylglycerol lipase [Holothuria leucospilota]|uniref:Pancreatic triacylglycerol lipase n=1 Tax=Holothuria leucospilota TaxID=206669 RepID=A0A9Q1BGC3_HOLLE|nr:Pancreatic triacylglycerol lipase [Holothuria leucospilota]
MKHFFVVLLGITVACKSVWGAQVCFDELGCFTDDTFCSDNNFPPWDPEAIKTQFFLYTRNDPSQYEVLDRKDAASVTSSKYDGSKGTKFIIHGYTDTIFGERFLDIKDRLLAKEDLNVIMVDWAKGADSLYDKARQNIRVVGMEIALLTALLNSQFGADFSKMHFIGHSLGAHTAGYAGAAQPGYGRITGMDNFTSAGLDPAGPGYRNVLDSCKLDPSDALFVDCIHTDGDYIFQGGAGLLEPLGHVDIYPNGGKDMPGCFLLDPVCDHSRVLYYFAESISSESCVFTAYPCDSWDNFRRGRCSLSCDAGECTQMGYNADLFSATGSFYLQTESRSPYCDSGSYVL